MKTDLQIEILRAIAIIQVLFVHILNSSFNANNKVIHIFFGILFQLVQCGVPLFIFLSGYTLSSKYWQNFSIIEFYKRRFKNVFFPYFSFSIIYTLLFLINTNSVHLILEPNFLITYFIFLIFRPDNIFYHFWFIGIIFSFYFIYPILINIIIRFKDNMLELLIISIIIQSMWLFFRFKIILNLNKEGSFLLYNISYSIVKYLFFSYISYFILGIYFNKNKDKIGENNYLFLILGIISSIIIFRLELVYSSFTIEPIDWIIYIPLIIFFFQTIRKIKKVCIFLAEIGKYSFGIYLIHAYLNLRIINILYFNSITYNYWYYYPILFSLTFSSSFSIIYCISFLPKSHYLIGKIRVFKLKNIKF